jgi:CheY-like chemotaxis protein
MAGGGELHIETSNFTLTDRDARRPTMAPGEYVALVVRDTGHGMDAQTKDHLFEPFFTTKPAGEGTGLGLPTVYGIVKQFGGFIFVDSEAGHGASFSLYWPAVARAIGEGVASEKRTAPDPIVGRETVLLVEDESMVRRFAKLVLERHGFRVVEAKSASDALEAAAPEQSIDLLVTDVVMPGDSGVDLADKLHRLRPSIPVLYISGYPANLIAQNGLLADASPHLLMKPFTSEQLLANIELALGRSVDRVSRPAYKNSPASKEPDPEV